MQSGPQTGTQIDKQKVNAPQIELTDEALTQLRLIIEQDFTLAGKYFRVLISGKGCDGFNYSTGFTDYNDDDFLIEVNGPTEQEVQILMDPFTAFYIPKAKIDFVRNYANEEEGFVVTNLSQAEFKGKFWRQSPEKVPPVLEQ